MAWSRNEMAQRAALELEDGFLCQFRHWLTHTGGQLYS